jgi:predicted nucleic acid-binding protein
MLHVTFDTGALIALDRRRARMTRLYAEHRLRGSRVHAPAVAIAEWWRGRTDFAEKVLAGLLVEPTDEELARVAGEALALVPEATTVDALVMATAARHGGMVYTSDVGDLERLRLAFPAVRVLSA